MIIVATDAPLSGIQLERLAKRSLFGLARTGSVMANSSGDSAIAFSIQAASHESIPHNDLTTFFQATVEVTEESLYDALFTAETVTGRDGNTLHALPPEKVAEIIRKYRNEAV
jgi:D-aminopeptidase